MLGIYSHDVANQVFPKTGPADRAPRGTMLPSTAMRGRASSVAVVLRPGVRRAPILLFIQCIARARARSQRDPLGPAQTTCGCRPPLVATMGVTGGRRRFRFRSNAGARRWGQPIMMLMLASPGRGSSACAGARRARRAAGSIDNSRQKSAALRVSLCPLLALTCAAQSDIGGC